MTLLRGFGLIILVAYSGVTVAAGVTVQNLRIWRAPDNTRLVFDLSGPLQHKVFTLDNPHRVVVDLSNAALRGRLPTLATTAGRYLKAIRSGTPAPNTLRIVLDLHRTVRPRTFVLKPNAVYGHRLVIDLNAAATTPAPSAIPKQPATPRRSGELVIAIDAGHGGEDYGATGPSRVREKNVVLAIAKRLYKLVAAAPGLRPVMIRTGDYYVKLRRRTAIARQHQADLFVSIHADAFPKRSARGSSVFALSQRGATSEMARWLADKENASDLVGGVSLHDKDQLLAKVLMDLSMTQTVSDSITFASAVLGEMRRVGRLHSSRVEQAGFAVLKSPDIPSVLVETAFISNPKEERLLSTAAHQQKVANAIFQGIKRYAASVAVVASAAPTPGEYVVRSGDTLSHIAQRFNVSISGLRSANKLNGTRIKVGQKLRIPSVGTGG